MKCVAAMLQAGFRNKMGNARVSEFSCGCNLPAYFLMETSECQKYKKKKKQRVQTQEVKSTQNKRVIFLQ